MDHSDGSRPAARALSRIDGSAAQLADSMVAGWQDWAATLVPIIGQRGLAALYGRSLALTAVRYPWLSAAQPPEIASAMDLPALKALLIRQSGADAEAGGKALAQTFRELLASLIGASLTERLLGSACDAPSSGPPKEASP